MSEVAELASRVRIADPSPGHCSGCLASAGPDVRFVDYNAAIDRGSFVDQNGAMGIVDSIDWLYLCESCVRQGMQALEIKPELHRKQLNEIRRLELEREHWKSYAQRLEATLRERPEPAPNTRRGRG